MNKATGGIQLLNSIAINEYGACHLAISEDKKYIAVANYNSGSVTLVSLLPNGYLGEVKDIVTHKGQNKPHAHCCMFMGEQLFVTDLGLDKVFCYTIENGKLVVNEKRSFKIKAGSGPRHLVNSGGFVYVLKLNTKSRDMINTTSVLNEKIDRLDKNTDEVELSSGDISIKIGDGTTYTLSGDYWTSSHVDRSDVTRIRMTFGVNNE